MTQNKSAPTTTMISTLIRTKSMVFPLLAQGVRIYIVAACRPGPEDNRACGTCRRIRAVEPMRELFARLAIVRKPAKCPARGYAKGKQSNWWPEKYDRHCK